MKSQEKMVLGLAVTLFVAGVVLMVSSVISPQQNQQQAQQQSDLPLVEAPPLVRRESPVVTAPVRQTPDVSGLQVQSNLPTDQQQGSAPSVETTGGDTGGALHGDIAKAKGLIASGSFQQGRELLLQVLQKNPTSYDAMTELVLAYNARGMFAEVIALAAQPMRGAPHDYRMNLQMNVAQAYRGLRDAATAVSLMRELSDLFPGEAGVLSNYGLLLFEQEQYDEARRVLNRALEIPSDRRLQILGNLFRLEVQAKNFGQAEQWLERVQTDFPNSPDLELNRGILAANQNLHTSAILHFEEVLKREPGNLDAMMRAGISYGRIGDFAAAAERFQKVLDAQPANAQAQQFYKLAIDEMQKQQGGK